MINPSTNFYQNSLSLGKDVNFISISTFSNVKYEDLLSDDA